MLDYAGLEICLVDAGRRAADRLRHHRGHGHGRRHACCPSWPATTRERRIAINTVGPHWDGNQVWFIIAGGAMFAAWPAVYAAAFSGFYMVMLLVLFGLFCGPLGFDYRSKIDERAAGATPGTGALFVGGVGARADLRRGLRQSVQGVPFQLDDILRAHIRAGCSARCCRCSIRSRCWPA